ncbi:MAG: nickel pincer cofactor biosynthesis protein LarB [Candidatus Thorarchaeota archaeon]|nr:MAG: nickel pincer cofactor biosynthesis protein LarB [Candidatus Thorarchaeota archaeon]
MNQTRKLLDELVSGKITVEEAEKQLKLSFLDDVSGLAMIDANRGTRSGIPEIVFGESKDASDIIQIVHRMLNTQNAALITRLDQEKLDVLESKLKEKNIEVFGKTPLLSVIVSNKDWSAQETSGRIAVITAGTSDIPYAKEAEALAKLVGVDVLSFYDVGVSGIHRLIGPIKEIVEKDVDALIVFAGMEGALPTVVAALVDIPVIGVPVPTGYGFGGKGETALASMLQSCSPGLAVVNIGNGLGAASVASLIAIRAAKNRP